MNAERTCMRSVTELVWMRARYFKPDTKGDYLVCTKSVLCHPVIATYRGNGLWTRYICIEYKEICRKLHNVTDEVEWWAEIPSPVEEG